VYDKETNQLHYQDEAAKAEGLGLTLTCKIAAEEMKHVAFQRAQFTTRCSVDDGSEFMRLRSKVARFNIPPPVPENYANHNISKTLYK
jgi:hypothetical protein